MPSAVYPTEYDPSLPSSHEKLNSLPRLVPRKKKQAPQNPLPVPETPSLPPVPDPVTISFVKPSRRVVLPSDLDVFLSSPTYSLILSFVFSLSKSAADKKISSIDTLTAHPNFRKILSILDEIEEIINAYPAADQAGSRFGNPAFRPFLSHISQSAKPWHQNLGLTSSISIAEVSTYLEHSFGNQARIDYGSGHELNFIIWLLCLNRLSLLPEPTFSALALVVFPRYIELLRKIQSTYYLEPAGSHGVWGLDDYHFLPFLFGASQLLHHPYITPLSIHNDLVLEEEGDEYLYLDMVRFTMTSKTVKGLKWTQPMLDDISGAKNWEKVEQGMRRMFVKEVLGKLPVMQHFLFGSLIPAANGMSVEDGLPLPESELTEGGQMHVGEDGVKHVHRNDAWGDCCGIKIPSSVAAGQEAQKSGDNLRRIPFD